MSELTIGMSGVSRFAGQRGRTADGSNRNGIRYPSPFFDIGHTYLPPSMKSLLRWCRYYYLVNPLINAVVHKMSEYPITEIILDEENPNLKRNWEVVLHEVLRIRAFQVEVGLDYHCYGMCVTTIHFPFDKWLICKNCNKKFKAANTFYKWRNLEYIMQCPNKKCGHVGAAKVQDFYIRDMKRIRLQRWNPENISVEPAFAGADPVYTFEIPLQLRNDMMIGKKAVLDTIPDVFVEAMRRNKNIRFAPENVFVFKRPIISQKDNGWGMPLIFPVLKDTFYLQILRKAQEMIAQEHIVPLRILFPQAGSGTSDPYTTTNLSAWKERIEGELAKWKYDQNYIPIMPLPLGNQTIGGDGKALGLYQEMEVWSRHIVAGMGVPEEFVFGGMQYSGSNVSMRMLENSFIGYRTDHHLMLNEFIIKRIAHFMGWVPVKAHMRRFKMADDLQRSGLFAQLKQQGDLSARTLLDELDFDYDVEAKRRELELEKQMAFNKKNQIAMAHIQGEVSLVTADYQAKAAAKMQPPAPDMSGAIGGIDPATGQPTAAQPGADGQQPGGQEGAMVDGQQIDPSMPQGSTVDQQEAGRAPTPEEMISSPLSLGTKGGGQNLLYLAKRAATQLQEMDEGSRNSQLEVMKGSNPQLYTLVLQLLMKQRGSQANPLDPMQSPLPQQRPERRAAHVGA